MIVGNNPLKVARTGSASYGHYYQCGGTYKGANAWINYNYATNCASAEAVITTTGTNSVFESDAIRVFMSCKDIVCMVNVNDGATLKGRVYRDIAFNGYKQDTMWGPLSANFDATTRYYLNVNGGVFASTGTYIFGNDRRRGATRTTIYEKGVTFDTSAGALNVHSPLERPYGKGVKSISLPKNSVTNFNYYVGDNVVPAESLTSIISNGIENGVTDACVVLRADKTVPVQYVVTVIDAVNAINDQTGTKHKVILATSPKK